MPESTTYNNWNMLAHTKGAYSYGRTWVDDELTLNDIELNWERDPFGAVENNENATIAFHKLADDVHIHSSYTRGDGFMLTRCVQHAAANPGKGYVFLDDFSKLVKKLHDGREKHPAHHDKASVQRWSDENIDQTCGSAEVETFNVADSDDYDRLFGDLSSDLLDTPPDVSQSQLRYPVVVDAASSYELHTHSWAEWDLEDATEPAIVNVADILGNLAAPYPGAALAADQPVVQHPKRQHTTPWAAITMKTMARMHMIKI